MMTEQQQAVAQILAVAILANNNDHAAIIANVAELVGAHLTAPEMDAAKAYAVELVLAVGDVPEPGPVAA